MSSTELKESSGSGLDANIAGLLCYLFGWISGLIFLLIDKRPFVRFHAAQSIGLTVFWIVTFIAIAIVSTVLTIITGILGYPIGILSYLLLPLAGFGLFVSFIFGMYKAFKNEKYKMPIVGNIVEKMVGA
ncbi:MAG TPA: DUF4870 domain-containing protein [Terriglobia bacterium]|nr:DUF4870 domain-containing protein [Terriglobia bacterium]